MHIHSHTQLRNTEKTLLSQYIQAQKIKLFIKSKKQI
nr:MAG TPA: hypothetical protein [Caudoviricetes sp.]